jgi:hypothetical protein
MAQNIGTLVTSAIRPNDSLDPIASAYAVEVKGGHHTYETLAERDAIILERREWGMLCTVYNDNVSPSNNKTYQLKYGSANTNITNVALNNLNWVDSSISSGVEWKDSVISVNLNMPGTPNNGDRYLVGTKPTDTVSGFPWTSNQPGFIAEWSTLSTSWIITTPTNGMTIRVDNDDNIIYKYEGVYPTGEWQRERVGQVRSISASTGDGSNYTALSEPDFVYIQDMIFLTTFNSTNTTSLVYLSINSMTNVQIKKPSSTGLTDFLSNDIKLNIVYSLVFDGTYFQLSTPYNTSSLNNKYYIEPTEYVVVPINHQYWIYGDLTIAGTLVNYGQVIIANGGMITTGGFFNNFGQLSMVQLGLGSGGGSTSYYDSETIDITKDNTIFGASVSAVVKHNSLTASHFNTANNGGATQGYVLSTDNTGDLIWQPSSSLSVIDYNTGDSFSDVSSIIFRGGVVSIPGGGTATGDIVTGPSPTVTVWIPAPNYVGYFTPTLNGGGNNRYISTPTNDLYTTLAGDYGTYGVGNWVTTTDFTNGTSRDVKNTITDHTAFSESEFSCFDLNTTLDFYLYDETDTVLYSITGYTVNSTNPPSSSGALTLTINSFSPDADRYKANVTGTINVSTYFPNGGRFRWKIVHNNSGDGLGANKNESGTTIGAITPGVYEYTKVTPIFFDSDLSVSSANISGTVDHDEDTPVLVNYSGVAFYDTGSTFGFTVSGIDLLNDITIPLTKQIDIICTNMAITSTHDGYTDGTKPLVGAVITGWTLDWGISGLTYSRTGTVNQGSQYIPGFVSGASNSISSSAISYITTRLYDYSLADSLASTSTKYLFDTYPTGSVNYQSNPLDSETDRLSMSGVISNGSSAFNSNTSLLTNTDELQYIFGRVIFPQTDFTQFYPSVNISANVDYSTCIGFPVKTFDVYTDTSSSPVVSSTGFNDYRWHVTSYGAESLYSTSFGNGHFTLNSNFSESYLHYDSLTSTNGTEDLVILIGVDSTGSNTTPDAFYFITGDPITYPGRQDPLTYNLDLSSSSKSILWTAGSTGVYIAKVWLFIGYKDSAQGKDLRMMDISFNV